jgi:poly(A) polymerase
VRTVLNVQDKLTALLALDAEVRDVYVKATAIVRKLRAAGHEAWFVGGAVRDLLLGRRILDIDITGTAGPAEVASLFARTVAVGESFGVTRVMVGKHQFEVALYRQEEGYSDGRHPDSVAPGTLEQDVVRRDFTVNGLVLDPESGNVVDLVGGLDDLGRRRLRAIGVPAERMAEDYLRTLRAVRFASCLDFELDVETAASVAEAAAGLDRISRERVRGELEKMAKGGGAARGLSLMFELGLLGKVLPAWPDADSVRVREAVALLSGLPGAVSLVQWLVVVVLAFEPGLLSGPVDFKHIRRRCAELADSLRLSVDERRLLEHRLVLSARMVSVRGERLARRVDLYRSSSFEEVCGMVRFLLTGRGLDVGRLSELVAERAALPSERLSPARFLNGDDLAAAGIAAGPRVGKLLAECEDLAAEGSLVSREGALEWLARRIGAPDSSE